MRVGVDLRSLLGNEETGIGLFSRELVVALTEADTTTEWVLFSNSFSLAAPLASENPRATIVHTRIPNSIHQGLLSLGALSLDTTAARTTGPIDRWFSPTIQISSVRKTTPHTVLVHDVTFLTNPEWYTPKQRLWHALTRARATIEQADHIITPSESTKRDITAFTATPATRIVVANPGVPHAVKNFSLLTSAEQRAECERVEKMFDLPCDYIVYVGAIEPRKNISSLLSAYERLRAESSLPHSLIIVGAHGWSNRDLFARMANSKYSRSIKYLGYVAAADKAAILAGATTAVYPSLYEGFGFPVLEAMAVGTPIVTSPRGAIPEVAGEAGTYSNPERPEELAQCISSLLTDASLRAKKIALGRERSKIFLWAATASTILSVLKS